MRVLKFAAFLIATSLLTAALISQESAFPGIPVTVPVSVEARHGKDVPSVQAADVVVMQGKQRDKVDSLEPVKSSQSGIQLFLLIDDSLADQIGTNLAEIRNFISSQPANVQVGVAYMRNGTAMIAQNLTSDHAAAAQALRLPLGELGSSASPYFSLQDLLKRWPAGAKTNTLRYVVMITDGVDPFWGGPDLDDPYVQGALVDAQRSHTVVSSIYARSAGHFGHSYFRTMLGQSFLSELADATGGEAYYLANDSPVSFVPYFNQLDQHLQNEYLLTFEAQPGKKAGLQRVKLSIEVPNAELVGPTAVWVGSAQ